ncbi:MAG: hypothetical protein WDA02_06165 [Saccharofermentanales bacterium]
MILTKTVNIKLNKRLIDKYGYIGNSGDIITIDVNDLPIYSTIKVEVKCDNCGQTRYLSYGLYLKNFKKRNIYTCYKCSRDLKIKKTKLEKYGDENFNNIEKFKETCLDKYGSISPLSNEEVIKKSKKTKLERYGDENFNNFEKTKNTKLIKYNDQYFTNIEKIKKTKLEKYGDKNYTNFEKTKKTNKKKYGVDYPLQNVDIYNKTIESIINKYGDYIVKLDEFRKIQSLTKSKTDFNKIKKKYTDLEFIDKKNGNYYIKCDIGHDHIFEINFNLFFLRKLHNSILCTKCNDPKIKHISSFELEVKKFLDDNNIKYESNNRKILNGKELDIYITDSNIALECNGIYWHSEIFLDKNYHLNKYLECKNKNIQLINIWEDDWIYKKEIIKSIILNKLNKTQNKIFARKCEIKPINDIKSIRNFLNKNHIQGFAPSTIKIGLYYNNEIVSIMTFSYRYINKIKTLELVRFCNLLNTNVIGSFNKLMNYFKNNYKNSENIITYADLSIFSGDVYNKYNFIKCDNITPQYYWVINGIRKHRFNYNKKKLIKEGFDPNLTEVEIMKEIGYFRIWGVGIQKWILKN